MSDAESLTDFEQAVADELMLMLGRRDLMLLAGDGGAEAIAEAMAPRVAAAIIAAYSDYSDGQRVALAALRGSIA